MIQIWPNFSKIVSRKSHLKQCIIYWWDTKFCWDETHQHFRDTFFHAKQRWNTLNRAPHGRSLTVFLDKTTRIFQLRNSDKTLCFTAVLRVAFISILMKEFVSSGLSQKDFSFFNGPLHGLLCSTLHGNT